MNLVYKKESILKRFRCQKSGHCCKCPGYVYVEDETIVKMAQLKRKSVDRFRHQYVRKKEGWQVVAGPNFNTHCFLDHQNRCSVYSARPKACRTYPNWPEIWQSEDSLLRETLICPGLKKAVQSIIDECS